MSAARSHSTGFTLPSGVLQPRSQGNILRMLVCILSLSFTYTIRPQVCQSNGTVLHVYCTRYFRASPDVQCL
ncbi:hypothetical protein BDQ12DRAFT_434404 [Crucibulum laeve]|uniref:Uncharacterized protein n=1 Tax=Crucibulum laeve TaxID=68775 RepID=A0A5C3M777_9AGAR|nr:hypothetical protein BDQ12DRAFT_434404 [Crucibulum laeve]